MSPGRQTPNPSGRRLPVDMKRARFHTHDMKMMIQIRNVPEPLHRRLKARAAIEGVSMSRYILQAIERALARPSRQELLDAIRSQPEIHLDPPPADILREERDSR